MKKITFFPANANAGGPPGASDVLDNTVWCSAGLPLVREPTKLGFLPPRDVAGRGRSSLEILDLRHFSSVDLRPLLEDETQVWSRLLSWDYSGSAEMILRYVDSKILPGYAAIERGKIFGYSFFVYEGSKGVIGDLFVENGGRLQDARQVELRLLTHVIETLQQSPGIHRVEAQLLAHESGAVARPFLETGFQRHPRLFMVLGLTSPAAALHALRATGDPTKVEIRPWTEADYQPAAAVITAAYRGHVDAQINDQYHTLSGSLRFLNNIVRFPGCGLFDAESSFVALDSGAKTVIGLILCSRVRADVGHVTQICVLPEYRSHGIGELLLEATAANLTKRKFTSLSLTVTEANLGAVALYRRLNFDSKRIFDAFVWEG
ncbi:MAG TPA: GNAT family N-acetyltransferase [Candidatus Sulfotelmatobacter sp.]